MTDASSRISTPASRAARGVRQGETRRANLELALLAAALGAFLLAVARVAAGHAIGAPGQAVDADIVRAWWGFTFALSRSAAIVAAAFLAAHVVRRLRGAIGDPWLLPIVCALCGLGLLTMVSVNDPWRERLLFGPEAGLARLLHEEHRRRVDHRRAAAGHVAVGIVERPAQVAADDVDG